MALFLMRFYGETGGELKPLQGETAQTEVMIAPSDETSDADERLTPPEQTEAMCRHLILQTMLEKVLGSRRVSSKTC